MNDFGLVSIITPTYNCGSFIAETIRCVLAQTYTNWEMIIIDDCSTDDTKSIVNSFNDSRIIYHCLKHNSGAAVARNTALRIAHGRWMAFLDSDDIWVSNKLEKQLSFMIQNGYAFSYHNYDEIDENSLPIKREISGPAKISRIGMLSYCWPGCLTVMYDVDKIGLIQIPNLKKNNDYAMWLIASKSEACHLLNERLASYRKRNGSISNHSYSTLIKWHYRLFRQVEHSNPISAIILTSNNIFWGVIKKIFYVN